MSDKTPDNLPSEKNNEVCLKLCGMNYCEENGCIDRKRILKGSLIPPDEVVKDLAFYKANCQDEYLHTPISVLRYISEMEHQLEEKTKLIQLLTRYYPDTQNWYDWLCARIPPLKRSHYSFWIKQALQGYSDDQNIKLTQENEALKQK